MSAALIDLVSVGAQDVYITGDPQVSFFRQNYKRHTNFAIKPERLDYIGTFGSGNEISIPIKSKGDLLSYIWIEGANINNKNHEDSILNNNADATFTQPTEFSLWVGGQEVSKLDSGFINSVHTHLYNESQAKATSWVGCDDTGNNHSNNSYVIPFFFSEDWTKSLPLVGLQSTRLKSESSVEMVHLHQQTQKCMVHTSSSTQKNENSLLKQNMKCLSHRHSSNQ